MLTLCLFPGRIKKSKELVMMFCICSFSGSCLRRICSDDQFRQLTFVSIPQAIFCYLHIAFIMCMGMLRCFSCVQHCAILWTVTCQDPLSMEFFRQEYWHGLLCPSPGELLNPRIKRASLTSSAWEGFFFF